MKNIKKVLALVLAVVLTLSLAANVFAANSNGTSKETGSITIANPQFKSDGTAVTYTAYKIFDLTYAATNTEGTGGTNPYAYFLDKNSKWAAEFVKIEEDEITYLYTGDGLVLTPVYDGSKAIIGYNVSVEDEFRPADFAAYVKDRLTGKDGTAFTGVKAEGLPFGYYLVDPSTGALASLTSTDPDVTIKDKNEQPEVEKVILEEKAEEEAAADEDEEDEDAEPEYDEVKANEASIGEAVSYQLSTEIPDMTGYDYYFFVVNDLLSKGLTFNDDVKVILGEGEAAKQLTVGTDYTVKTVALEDKNGELTGETELRIVFKDMVEKYYDTDPAKNMAGTPIVITYSATVNQDALIGDPNNNTAKIEYSNDPTIVPEWDEDTGDDQDDPRDPGYEWNDPDQEELTPPVGEGPESETKTYVSEVELTKVADDGTTTLTGAKFSISGVNQKAVIVNETIFRAYDEDTDKNITEFYYRLKDGTYTTVAPENDTATVRYDEQTLAAGETWTDYVEATDGIHVGYYYDVAGVKTLIADVSEVPEDAAVYQLIYTNCGLYYMTAGADGEEPTYTMIDEDTAADYVDVSPLYKKVNIKGWDSFEDNTKYVKVETVAKDSKYENFEAEGWVDEDGKLTFQGLGAGTYYITELVAPDGYNILTAPLELTIDFATSDENGEVTGEFSAKLGTDDATVNNGVISFNVVNNKGSELPETGGIGTTIFYILGGILLAGAAVLLITKKRMSSAA